MRMPQPTQSKPEERIEVAGTQTSDPMLIQNLNNDMVEARRLLNTVLKSFTVMDDLTLSETLTRVHGIIVDDLYYRVRELCEPRGRLGEYEADVAMLVQNTGKLDPEAENYHSTIMGLYRRLLARYQYWLDLIGVLLPNVPLQPNDAERIIEMMELEYKRAIRRARLERQLNRRAQHGR